MISCKAIRTCQSLFHGKPLVSSLPQSANSKSKKNLGFGMIAMVQGDNSMQDSHSSSSISTSASKQEIKRTLKSQALQYHQFPTTKYIYELLLNKTTNQFEEFEDDSTSNFERLQGVGDDSWEEWEEWMGWEGAGTLDYSNHINSST